MDSFIAMRNAIAEKIKAGNGQPFAVLDFDNTCIVNDVGEAIMAYLCRRKLLKNNLLLGDGGGNIDNYHERVIRRYHRLLNRGNIQEAYILCGQLLAGFTPQEAESLVYAAIDDEGENIKTAELYGFTVARGLAPRPQVGKLIELLEKDGVSIWIVSASSEIAVRAAMERFDIPGNLIGLKNKIVNGVFTSEIERPFSILGEKVDCIKTIEPARRPLLGAGDSMNDFPMLEYSDIKVVVDRQNQLASEARSRGWFII